MEDGGHEETSWQHANHGATMVKGTVAVAFILPKTHALTWFALK